MKQQSLSNILEQDLDENMKVFRIVKTFRGGRNIYYALLPKNKRVKRGMWNSQLDEWGEGTNGGHESGWTIKVTQVKRIPKESDRLAFNMDFVE